MASDPEVEGFLALLAARRAPKTVDAYKRDLRALGDWLGGPPSKATSEDLERWLADLRAAGLSPATIARRVAAVRSFFRHLILLGARTDSPAAALELPRRRRRLPRTLSAAEAQRLIEAAPGTTPRSLRDRALVELLYGAGLRVSEAVGLGKTDVDLERRLVACTGKGGKERVVPVGRHAIEALRRYLAHGRPYLDRRHRPELSLNAQGGALTRAGAFLILRKLAERAGLEPERVHPHLLRHSFPTHLLEGGPPRAGGVVPEPAEAGGASGPRAGTRSPTPAPPFLRDPSPRRGRRHPQRPGDARPRRSRHDRALHARERQTAARRLFQEPSARAPQTRSFGQVTLREPKDHEPRSARRRAAPLDHCSRPDDVDRGAPEERPRMR